MTAVCPAGHESSADDYCDVCGMPIGAQPSQPPPQASAPASSPAASSPAASGAQICPNCSTENVAEALFCEACGYDFTTGTLPRPPAQVPAATPTAPTAEAPSAAKPAFSYVAEVWIDPDWYGVQQSPDRLPSPGLPDIVPLTKSSILVGRVSNSRNIHPDIDCETDSGASRRQCQLTTDDTRWWVEDLDSANGTFVGQASEPLPMDPIPVGIKHELRPGDRIYVGAWTRIVIRAATDDELTSLI